MPRLNINYQKAIIYKLVCNDLSIVYIYVGLTTNFIKRKQAHKDATNNQNNKAYNEKKYQIIRENGGWDNWKMIMIEEYPCNNSLEARSRERYWQEQTDASMNSIKAQRSCIERTIDTTEKRKNKYESNKKYILEQKKQYYINNKDEINKKRKEVYLQKKLLKE
jgi:hypothetical protein